MNILSQMLKITIKPVSQGDSKNIFDESLF